MLSGMEIESYTKLIARLGVLMCVAALVVPAVVLRETDVLRISEKELQTLTPVAQREIARRQDVAEFAGNAALFVGLGMLVGGVFFIARAAPGLRGQEKEEERRRKADLDEVLQRVRPQSEQDRRDSVRADFEVELETAVPQAETSPTDESAAVSAFSSYTKIAREVERAVLDRISALEPEGFDFLRAVKLANAGSVQFDGLLAGRLRPRDVLIEVKFISGRSLAKNLMVRVTQAVAQAERYRTAASRNTTLWLIVVTDSEVSLSTRERGAEVARQFRNLALTIISRDEIAELTLPPEAE